MQLPAFLLTKQSLLKRDFVTSQNPLSFVQSGEISIPSFIFASEGNYFSHYKNIREVFIRWQESHLNNTVSVAVCSVFDCVPLWSLT